MLFAQHPCHFVFAGEAGLQTVAEQSSEERDNQSVVRQRLIMVAIVAGVVISLLAVLFGYLRLDHATRGFYSGKLQMVAVVEVLLILGLAFYLYVQLIH